MFGLHLSRCTHLYYLHNPHTKLNLPPRLWEIFPCLFLYFFSSLFHNSSWSHCCQLKIIFCCCSISGRCRYTIYAKHCRSRRLGVLSRSGFCCCPLQLQWVGRDVGTSCQGGISMFILNTRFLAYAGYGQVFLWLHKQGDALKAGHKVPKSLGDSLAKNIPSCGVKPIQNFSLGKYE